MKLLLLLGLVCLVGGTQVRYDGYKVYEVTPTNQEQVKILNSMQERVTEFDFWKNKNQVGEQVDIMIPPSYQTTFENAMKFLGIPTSMYADDVQRLIDNVKVSNATGSMTWTEYHTLESIHSWFDELVKAYPKQVSIINAGKSYENRTLKGVKIAYGKNQKVVFLEGTIHAREWISPATVTYIVNEILTSTDPTWRKIAESFEWHIVPVINPDGYSYTFEKERLWRKTRKPYDDCIGADPNRNWDAHWLEQGASSKPCAETYAGPNAFSEGEMSTLSKYISTIGSRMKVYIAFHSYGQMMLLPYGHTKEHLDNYDEAMVVAKATVEGIAKRYGTKFTYGNIAETIYLASGGSIDWVKQEFKTPLVCAFELRDKKTFILPEKYIIPTGEEMVDGITALFLKGEELGIFTLG